MPRVISETTAQKDDLWNDSPHILDRLAFPRQAKLGREDDPLTSSTQALRHHSMIE